MGGPLRFYFDYVSPYAYLASTQIEAFAEGLGRTVEPVPIVFGALVKKLGVVPPAENPPRRAYIFARDLPMRARLLGVRFRMPPAHPFVSLYALRVSSLPMEDATRRRLVRQLFHACWGEGAALTDRAVVDGVAAAAGVSADALAAAESPESKDRLRLQTDEALAAGVFGMPTFIVDGELFFDNESLPLLEARLRGDL